MAQPSNLFWYSSVTVRILFCAHLLWTGLARTHPIFTSYLVCSVLRSFGAFYFTAGYGSLLPLSYTYFWLWSEPVLLLLQIAMTLEVHAGMWKEYAHVVTPARPMLFFVLLTAIVFAALPVKSELSKFGNIQLQVVMQFEFLAKRYISTVLALFLGFSALLFLIVVRNSVKSNLLRHESMLAAYFGIYSVCYFAVNMGWASKSLTNNYMLSALTLCLVIWISVFRPSSELAQE